MNIEPLTVDHDMDGVPAIPGTASGESTEAAPVPDADSIRSSSRTGIAGGTPLSMQERAELTTLRRKLDELYDELRRLTRDRDPDPTEYPEELMGLVEYIASLRARL